MAGPQGKWHGVTVPNSFAKWLIWISVKALAPGLYLTLGFGVDLNIIAASCLIWDQKKEKQEKRKKQMQYLPLWAWPGSLADPEQDYVLNNLYRSKSS